MGFAHAISELRRERETRDRRPDFQASHTGRRNYEPELGAEVTNRSHEPKSRGGVTRRTYEGRFDGPVNCTRLSAAAMGGVGPDSSNCGARQKSIAAV